MIGYEFKLMSHTDLYYEVELDEYTTFSFDEICELTGQEDMKPLTPAAIERHALGKAMVAFYSTPHRFENVQVCSYAGITGFEEQAGKKLAVVGGVLTHPWFRGLGLAQKTVEGLVQEASSLPATHLHMHDGLMARCNNASAAPLAKLGFEEQAPGPSMGKIIMQKLF